MLIKPTVQEVENLGDLICVSAHTQQRVFGSEMARVVEPPFTLVRISPAFSVKDVLKSAASFGPVESHQFFQQSGILLVKYQSTVFFTLPGTLHQCIHRERIVLSVTNSLVPTQESRPDNRPRVSLSP